MSWLQRLLGGRETWSDEWEEAGEEAGGPELGGGELDDFPYANRSAVVLRPKKPFRDWLSTACGPVARVGNADSLPDRTVYLLEPWEGSWDSSGVLASHAKAIFERELEEWTTDRKVWPKKRDLTALEEWFEIEMCSGVVDLAGGPLETLDFG
jgi:hypothetical protein